MKKLLSLLFSILLVSTLVFSVTACKNGDESESIDETVAPVTMTIETETDDDGEAVDTLTEISLSAAAKSYIDNGDLTGLKTLFDKHASDASTEKAVKDAIACFAINPANEEVTLTIPNVEIIASNAVSNLSFITKLVVGSSVKEIESGAFVGLSGLKSIELPFIGGKVGAVNDAKLFGYIFGSIGTDGLTAITQNYNEGTESTASLYVPTSLKTVIVTGDVKETVETVKYYIKDDVCYFVDNTHESTTVEVDGTTYDVISTESKSYKDSAVQPYAFYGVTTIETVEFKGAITAIPEYTFYGCSGIKTLSFKDTITTIGKFAYANCTSLRVLTLGAVEICEGAFNGCTSLGRDTETSFGGLDISNVVSIGKDAFVGCSSLNKDNLEIGTHTEESLADAFDEDFFADEE